jgi:hypothetical protein
MQLTDYCGFQVYEHGSRYVLARAGLAEEGVETVVTTSEGLVGGHLPVGLNTVLQAVQFPACVTDLDARLPDVYGDAFPL